MIVGDVRIKSSAASISILPRLSGREAAASRPSGSPVVKKKSAAEAVVPSISISAKAVKKQGIRRIVILLLEDWELPSVCRHAPAGCWTVRTIRYCCGLSCCRVPSTALPASSPGQCHSVGCLATSFPRSDGVVVSWLPALDVLYGKPAFLIYFSYQQPNNDTLRPSRRE